MNPKKPERPDRTHSSAHDPTTKPDPFTMPFAKTHQRGSYSRQPIQVSARNLLMTPSNLHIRSATSRRRPTHPTMLLVASTHHTAHDPQPTHDATPLTVRCRIDEIR
ncbi:hypothetical protein C1H46_023117 [Malus baccata]|uniref:Uncharacterized protein n=1 Tax=Malus baccata TaxID=106549 RepID=A0A540LXR9_MALBA|nr:hypothetical protein C1H46_023117 [Malus baccata]